MAKPKNSHHREDIDNGNKEGLSPITFWPRIELKTEFYETCKRCKAGIGDMLSLLMKDFNAGRIYDLPTWEPIDKSKFVHYKDNDGKWIYLTQEEFFARINPKGDISVPEEERSESSDEKNDERAGEDQKN